MRLSIIVSLLFGSLFSYSQDVYKIAIDEYLNGDLTKSITLLTNSIEAKQQVALSYMYRGAAKSFLKRFDEALSDLNISKGLDTANIKLDYYYGKLYLLKGDYPLAITHYSKAISKNPKDAFSYDERAAAKGFVNDYRGAIADENIAIALDSTKEFFYTDRGYSLLKLHQYDSAINDFNRSLQLEPNQKAFADRGLAFSLIGQHAKAIDDYSSSLALNSNDGEIYYYRALSYKELKRTVESCYDLQKSKTLGYAKAIDLLAKAPCL